MEITLLTLERANHYIRTIPDDPKTFDFAVNIITEITNSSTSPYILSSLSSNIINYLSTYEDSNSKIRTLLHSYYAMLENLRKEYGLDSIDDLSQEFINYYYDKVIIEENVDEEENDIERKRLAYKSISRLLNERDVCLAAYTNDVQFIHYDLSSSLYTINPDLLEFYDDDKLKFLRNAVINKWGYTLMINQWQFALQRCNSIIQSFEDDSITVNSRPNSRSASLTSLINSHNQNHSHDCHSNVQQFSESESRAYWEIRWLVLFGMFLAGNYDLVAENFNNLTTTNKTIPGIMFNSIDSLNNFATSVIDKNSIIRIITISILLSQNNEKRHEFFQNEVLIEAFYDDQPLKDVTESFDSINFSQLRIKLLKMKDQFPWFDYLDSTFDRIQTLMLQKLIITFLSLINRVSFDEISQTFNIPKTNIIDFIIKITSILDLPLFINEELEIIEYVENVSDDQTEIINKLHDQINDESICFKINKLNSIIALADKDADENDENCESNTACNNPVN